MQPRHKLRYFEKAGWPKNWVEDVVEMVREEYNLNYRHLDEAAQAEETDESDEPSGDEDDDTDNGTLRPHRSASSTAGGVSAGAKKFVTKTKSGAIANAADSFNDVSPCS